MLNDDFKGSGKVILFPDTRSYPVLVSFKSCTTSTSNDGSLPYGDIISSVAVRAFDPWGQEQTSKIVTTAPVVAAGNLSFTMKLSYFGGAVPGEYILICKITCASGFIHDFFLKGVVVDGPMPCQVSVFDFILTTDTGDIAYA